MKTSEKLYEIEYILDSYHFYPVDIEVRNGIRIELYEAPTDGLFEKLEEYGEVEYLGNGIILIE